MSGDWSIALRFGDGRTGMDANAGKNGDDDLLVRLAWLYYVADRNQGEIAAQLRVSRFKITRLLARAREQGIVKIVIDLSLKKVRP